jgi:hypothetical protein
MAWGNVVLSENNVAAGLAEQAYEADIATRGTAETTSLALLPTVASRGSQTIKGKTADEGFEGIVGANGSLREVLDLVRTGALTDSTAPIGD